MRGIYITDMDMPSCEVGYRAYMDFRIWNDGTVEARIGPKETEYKAVHVPPHGRLGDLDALKERVTKRLYASNHGSMAEAYFAALIDLIDTAPTIIPADHSGEVTEMVEKEARG